MIARTCFVAVLAAACGREPVQATPIRFLHTFGPEETELFNAAMIERGIVVEPSLVPFARGQQVIGEILRAGAECPDLVRIDATWLPGLAAARLLQPVPGELAALDWTPEAAALAGVTKQAPAYAIPETVDGLVVVRDESRPPPPSGKIVDIVAAARAAHTQTSPYPLGVRVDGYWFVPWLRAEGIELALPDGATGGATGGAGIDGPGAVTALASFARLFGDVAPPPPPAGSEAPDELRRWQAHEIAYWITGPWQLGPLAERDRLVITPIDNAPRGGQLLVVPTCARHPDDGWRLARELTDTNVARRFADQFATVPTRTSVLETSPPLVRSLYEALRSARPLPRVAATPFLFDDLNPALAAIISGDATPEEAVTGIRRGWNRIARLTRTAEGTR